MDQITSNKDLSLLSNEGKLYSSTLKPIQVQLQKIYDECNTGYAGTIETSEVAADLSQVWGFSHLVSGAKALAKAFDDTEVVAASDEFNSANRRLNELCDLNGLPEAIESLGTELAEYEGIDSAAIEEKAKKNRLELTWSSLLAYQHQLEVNKLALRQQYREIAKTEQAAILTLPAGKAVDGSALEEAITNLDAAILEQSAKTETARKAAEVGATETPEGIVESIVKGFLTQRVEDIELKLDLKTLRPIIAKMNHNEALSADELKNLMGALKVVFESTKDLREQLVGEVKRLLEDNKSYVRMGVAAVGGTAGALVMGPLGGAVGAILGKNACDFVFGKAQPQGRIEAIVDGVMSGLGALAGGSVVTALIAAGVSAAHEQDPKVEAALDVGAKATAANAMGAGMATSASIGFLGTLIQGNPGVVREVAADVQHVVGKFREKGFKAVGDVALGFGRLFVSSAKNVVRAGIERKWTELAVRIGVIALPVIAGVLHLSAVGYAVASFILGLYLVEKYFANRPMFAGKATLDNEEFLKAVVARAKEEKAETELERLSNAFNYVLGRVDLNQYDVTTKDEITARLARVDQVKAILAKKFD